MSFTLEKLSQKGSCANVAANTRILIDPELHDAKGNVLVPELFKLEPSWAFQLMEVNVDGTFEVQNVDCNAHTLKWFCEFPHSIQW